MAQRGDRMLAGHLDSLAMSYMFPLPVYLADKRLIVSSADQATAMLCLQRLSMIQRSVVAIRSKVTAIDLPRNGRFRVWVDWLEVAIPQDGTRKASAIYFCSNTNSGLKIEMVNYTQLSMPELKPQFAALARTA
jgi:hypothetical protein